MTKNQIREFQKSQRDSLSKERQDTFSKQIRQLLFDTEEYRTCMNLYTFISFRSEVDTYEIIKHSLKQGKRVYVPRVEPQGMEFFEITDLSGLLPSRFGVLEPPAEESKKYIVQEGQNNLMLLPGLAFDRSGNRIGYGAGYYDRYLATHMEASFYKIALAYDFQVMDHLPSDEYDIKADAIITPEQMIRCHSAQARWETGDRLKRNRKDM